MSQSGVVGAAQRSEPVTTAGLAGQPLGHPRAVVLGLVGWSLTGTTSSEGGCTKPSWSSSPALGDCRDSCWGLPRALLQAGQGLDNTSGLVWLHAFSDFYI